MLADRETVVRREDHIGVGLEPGTFQHVQDAADLRVHIRDVRITLGPVHLDGLARARKRE